MRRQKKSTKKERRQKKPTKLTERDLMRLALAVSRSTEIAATLEALNARGRDLSGAQQAAAAELQGLRFELGGRYRLEAGDSIDTKTGAIVRAKPSQPDEGKKE